MQEHETIGPRRPERALLVALEYGAREPAWSAAEGLDELERLVETAGGVPAGREIQKRPAPDPATFIGTGKAREIELRRLHETFDIVVFDEELSPGQQRNLESAIGCPVLDRTAVILDIFAQRARSREARLQVELALLNYRLPRLKGKGTALSRLGGGIGTRGPGETKLEVDRRRIRERIASIRRDLEEIRAHRARLRQQRSRNLVPVVAVTGYTNAGKSTLHRVLAGSDVLAEDRLFATLDATARRMEPAQGEPYLLVDTVGFINNLPHQLVAAFRSTLEEVAESDLLLHVVDCSHSKMAEQMQIARAVLAEIGAGGKPELLAFNKADRVDGPDLLRLLRETPGAFAISAVTGEGLDRLQEAIQTALASRRRLVDLVVPYEQGHWVAWIHQRGRVLLEEHVESGTRIRAELEAAHADKLRAALEPSGASSDGL
jgi:GTPase